MTISMTASRVSTNAFTSLSTSSSTMNIITIRQFSSTTPASSRVGCRSIPLPTTVQVTLTPPSPPLIKNPVVTVKGPLATHSITLPPFVKVGVPLPTHRTPKLTVAVMDPTDRSQKAMWGTSRALLANLVEGVSEGFVVPVRLVGVGYRAAVEETVKDSKKVGVLSLKLGHSHPVVLEVPEGVKVSVPNPQRLLLSGTEKNAVTQFAAKIRAWRPPEPYNQKGVFVGDETIKKKEGKKR
ncbi:hypothetical protein HDU76_006619 [Blyttiomyces sp. JEL0837]|nr:hypothetical protein HDU76_006619 [Blyttiomyces sp. JEL0837]